MAGATNQSVLSAGVAALVVAVADLYLQGPAHTPPGREGDQAMTQTRRTRSGCGWRHVAAALSDEECAQLTDRVRALIPDADLTVHDPPDPHDITLPAPRIDLPGPLAHLASDEHIDRLSHSHGKAFRDVVRALHGEFDSVPDQIVRPTTEQDVVDVLSWAGDAGV